MQQLDILHKRNQFIFVMLLFTVTFHIFTPWLGFFNLSTANLIVCITISITLSFLYFLKVNPKVFQYCLIFGWHFFVLFLTYQSENIITLYSFLYFLIILSIYRSLCLNIIFSLIVVTESLIVLNFSHSIFKNSSGIDDFLFIFFLILVCCISLLQTFYVKYLWNRVEQTTIDREYNLISKEAYLNMFFEHAEDAIVVFNLDDTIITVNPAFERLYGWTKEESIGKTLPLVPPGNAEAAAERTKQLLMGQSLHLFETQDMRRDGTSIDVQISISPIYDPNGQMIAMSLISRDISYIKENERLVLQSEKLKLVGEMAAGVAHEIRNPMTVISGFVQMMNEGDSSPYHEYTKLMEKEIERIDLILSEFLVLSRPQANQFVPIHLGQTLAEVAHLFQYEFQQRNITLKINNDYDHIVILGNANQIKQIFINLFKNSMEAINDCGAITIELCKDLDENTVFISIKDTGYGIPPHVLDRIFEPFYTTKTKGTGLGMMIINKIIEDHRGTIQITSKQNVGTEILISFPIDLN
ncbi:two-component system sensor histidine kinase NtrB [Solibacillus sp. FSL K6-1523]|uniref:two-component system sensor histidine kinase NtrB n=1 Tax=Solibacillus sp. FSL K6-1523 TaxID=2921471 RepID=UPI0030F56983